MVGSKTRIFKPRRVTLPHQVEHIVRPFTSIFSFSSFAMLRRWIWKWMKIKVQLIIDMFTDESFLAQMVYINPSINQNIVNYWHWQIKQSFNHSLIATIIDNLVLLLKNAFHNQTFPFNGLLSKHLNNENVEIDYNWYSLSNKMPCSIWFFMKNWTPKIDTQTRQNGNLKLNTNLNPKMIYIQYELLAIQFYFIFTLYMIIIIITFPVTLWLNWIFHRSTEQWKGRNKMANNFVKLKKL